MSESKSYQPNRRDFLTAAAGATAAAALMTGVGAAAAPPTRPSVQRKPRVRVSGSEKIRVGVIGTGGMGTGHCHGLIGMNQGGRASLEVVALADVCDERLENARKGCASKQGITVDAYRDYRELLDRDDVHAVLIASPEHWHAQHVIDALTAGKDVYCEKPVTLRLDQALDVRDAVMEHTDNIFQVGTQGIMQPKYNEARAALKAGAIGKPVWSQTSYCRNSTSGEWNYYAINDAWKPGVNLDWKAWLGYMPHREWDPKVYARWRRYKDFSTGIIGDLLVHVVTPMVFALDLGWPTRVVASGEHVIDKDMENHDQVNIVVHFGEDEHQMVVAGSTANATGLETMIRGHKANMYLGGRDVQIRPEQIFADDVDRREIECRDIGNDQDALRLNWLDCIRTRQPAKSNIDLATKVMVMVDLATRSMWEGAAFAFDPKTLKAKKA